MNPSAGRGFYHKISAKVYLFHPVLTINVFHVRDTTFVRSSVVQCSVFKYIKEPRVAPPPPKKKKKKTLSHLVANLLSGAADQGRVQRRQRPGQLLAALLPDLPTPARRSRVLGVRLRVGQLLQPGKLLALQRRETILSNQLMLLY